MLGFILWRISWGRGVRGLLCFCPICSQLRTICLRDSERRSRCCSCLACTCLLAHLQSPLLHGLWSRRSRCCGRPPLSYGSLHLLLPSPDVSLSLSMSSLLSLDLSPTNQSSWQYHSVSHIHFWSTHHRVHSSARS